MLKRLSFIFVLFLVCSSSFLVVWGQSKEDWEKDIKNELKIIHGPEQKKSYNTEQELLEDWIGNNPTDINLRNAIIDLQNEFQTISDIEKFKQITDELEISKDYWIPQPQPEPEPEPEPETQPLPKIQTEPKVSPEAPEPQGESTVQEKDAAGTIKNPSKTTTDPNTNPLVSILHPDATTKKDEKTGKITVTKDDKTIATYNTQKELDDAIEKKVYQLNNYLIKPKSDDEKLVYDKKSQTLQINNQEVKIDESEDDFFNNLNSKEQIEYNVYKHGQEKTLKKFIAALNDPNFNDKENLEKALLESVEEGVFDEIEPAVAGQLIYENNPDQETANAIAEAANGRDCTSFFGSIMCSFTGQQTQRELRKQALINDMKSVQDALLSGPSEGITIGGKTKWFGLAKDEKGETICKGSMSLDKCKKDAIISGVCKNEDDKSCLKQVEDKFRASATIDIAKNNEAQLEQYFKTHSNYNDAKANKDKLINDCKDGFTSQCQSTINNFGVCNTNPDSYDCKVFKEDMGNVINQGFAQPNFVHGIIAALKNPDQGGLRAAKYFGFEADYSSLPDFLAQDFETSICAAKIEGYLDKEVSNAGGVSRYECLDNDLSTSPSDLCLNIQADIRGQRTKMTPDNKTLISFSYYIRAPESQDIVFIVASAYTSNNVVKKEALVEMTNISKGGVRNSFETVEILIENADNLDENSFIIAIGGFYKDKTPYVQLKAPIVLAVPENYDFKADRDESNSQAKEQEESDVLDTTDLLDLMNI